MDDLKHLIEDNYIKYASYVILERAIPDALDGLKPVQRRILHSLHRMHDGRFHKVVNIVGQTMATHPHGDAAINDALVNMANKVYTIDRQGNFGNLHTGDPAAAGRYIEARLTPLSIETLFSKEVTEWTPSYDGRTLEPVRLPAKIPLILLHGAEGIAVGMSTRIFPHNFAEVLQAQIDYLEGREFTLLPDFSSKGMMDVQEYSDGSGKIRLRAVIEEVDNKTLKITEICASTTTESVINSIDDAAKKGKLKLESIHDFTAESVNIEIRLPRGQHAPEVKKALYAFTQCEVSLTAIPTVIYQDKPQIASTTQLVAWHSDYLKGILKKELEIEQAELERQLYLKTLEQIFIENKLYRNLEKVRESKKLKPRVATDLEPYHDELTHEPTDEDLDYLLALPMRRISLYDKEKNEEAMAEITEKLQEIARSLKNLKAFAVKYLKEIKKRYASGFERQTKITTFSQFDAKDLDQRKVRIGLDRESGFVGSKVNAEFYFDAKPKDRLVVFYKDGCFSIIPVEEKNYVKRSAKILFAAVVDKNEVYTAAYQHKERPGLYLKRFCLTQYTLGKSYHFLSDEESLKVLEPGEKGTLKFKIKATSRSKEEGATLDLAEVPIKSFKVRGQRVAHKEVTGVRLVMES